MFLFVLHAAVTTSSVGCALAYLATWLAANTYYLIGCVARDVSLPVMIFAVINVLDDTTWILHGWHILPAVKRRCHGLLVSYCQPHRAPASRHTV